MMVERTFTVRLEKDEESGRYAARCVELSEAISYGKTEEEAISNLREALELVLEEYESRAKKERGKLIPHHRLRDFQSYREKKSSRPVPS